MIYHQRTVLAALAAALALAIACGSAAEPGTGVAQISEQNPVAAVGTVAVPVAAATQPAAVTAAPVAAPAPTSRANVEAPVEAAVTDPPEPAAQSPSVGTGVGDLSPSYLLRLADGSTVTSADLTAAGKPVFLMFTATW